MSRMPRRINVNGTIYEALVRDQPEVHVKGRRGEGAVFKIDGTKLRVEVIDISGDTGEAFGVQLYDRGEIYFIGKVFTNDRKAYERAKDLANSIALAGPAKNFRDIQRHSLDRDYKLVTEGQFEALAPISAPWTWD